MIAASVWIAPEIWNAVSDRDRAVDGETTPTDSDWRSANGEPIAATGVADLDLLGVAERQRPQRQAVGVDLEQRDVGVGVVAADARLDLVAVGELDVDLARLAQVAAPRRS